MRFKEYGAQNKETVILIHGGGLSWWNFREEARMLRNDCRVILPIIDGHADSDRPFTSIEDNAREIIDFIDRNLNGQVLLIGGLSLGGQIALEILSQRKDICRYAIIESASIIPSKALKVLIGPALFVSYRFIKNRVFARKQFDQLRIDEKLFKDYYRDSIQISRKDMTAFLKGSAVYTAKESLKEATAGMIVLAGGKENSRILNSVRRLKKMLPNCRASILRGLYHGEFSIDRPDLYSDIVRKMLGSK